MTKIYRERLTNLHGQLCKEGVVSDYLIWRTIMKWFDVNISFYEFGLLKKLIMDWLKRKGKKL